MDAAISSSDSNTLVVPRTASRRIRTPIVPATAADHPTIACFLGATLDRAITAEFKAALDDPFYHPHDRLLVRRGTRILAHAHITHRVMQFGAQRLPVAGLHDLCVAPAAQGQGFGAYLLAAAERAMVESGAVVGWMKTAAPHFFRRSGWALCGRHNHSQAGARALLSRLLEMGVQSRRSRHLHIRPWRQWELGALARIYQQNLHGTHGLLERTGAYWQWLVNRESFDEIYVALEGPEQLDLREQSTRIIGYAVVRGSRVVEVLTSPDRPRAALELLARVCGDAIEYDRADVTLFAPPEHPLHAVFLDAGGLHRHTEADRGAVLMARLPDPLAVLAATGARVPAPCREGKLAAAVRTGIAGRRPEVSDRVGARRRPRDGQSAGTQLPDAQRGRLHAPGPRSARLGLGRPRRPAGNLDRAGPTGRPRRSPPCRSTGRCGMRWRRNARTVGGNSVADPHKSATELPPTVHAGRATST